MSRLSTLRSAAQRRLTRFLRETKLEYRVHWSGAGRTAPTVFKFRLTCIDRGVVVEVVVPSDGESMTMLSGGSLTEQAVREGLAQ